MSGQRTQTFTFFTDSSGTTRQIFPATFWCEVSLLLETAGPVAVGLSSEIAPVTGGKGILLQTGGPPTVVKMQQGDVLYVVSGTVNRISVVISPEFLEQATETIDQTTLSLIPGWINGMRALLGKPPAEAPKPICPPKLKAPRF